MLSRQNRHRTQVYIDKRLINGLDSLAGLKGTTRSQLIRDAIYFHLLKEYKKEMKQEEQFQNAMDSIGGSLRGYW